MGSPGHSVIIETYILRLSRLCYLKNFCHDEHPVLIAENHLVEMAQAKLQEYLLINYTGTELRTLGPALKFKIHDLIIDKIKLYDRTFQPTVSLIINEHLDKLFDLND